MTRPGRADSTTGTSRRCASPVRRSHEAEPEPIRDCRDRLDQLVAQVEHEDSTPLWPVYGGLLVNLRNILDAMDEVAAANPLSQPPLPFSRR